MKKNNSFGAVLILLTVALSACGGGNAKSSSNKSKSKTPSSSVQSSSVSQGPKKSVEVTSISLGNSNDKAYITVSGTQQNYTTDDFVWAWGLMASNSGTFEDGQQTPGAADFVKQSFNANGSFTVQYCLTDIENIHAGTLYRIYGGTPESYGYIPFASNQFGASDATRKYYLRQDQDNDLVFEYIQPITYSKASIVEVAAEGEFTGGAYLKFGGANSKNLTMETINGWHEANKIAGDFQRVIPADSYSQHVHTDTERFWRIEGNEVYFYLYVGFIAENEGWMLHFDLVGGSTNAGAQTSVAFNGETPYTIDGATYKIYSDKNKSGESNYWGCLGVYRVAAAQLKAKKKWFNRELNHFFILS